VWLVVSSRGHSKALFHPQGLSINGEICREECIRQRLHPFIQEHHADDEILLWPDFASAHYVRQTRDLLEKLEIPDS